MENSEWNGGGGSGRAASGDTGRVSSVGAEEGREGGVKRGCQRASPVDLHY